MVAHPELDAVPVRSRPQLARRAVGGVLQRVVDQVRHDAGQELAVGVQHRQVGRHVYDHAARLARQSLDDLTAHVLEQHSLDRQRQLPALQARGGQQVLDETQQPVALSFHPAEELLAQHRVLGEFSLLQGLRVADQRRDRRAQLVGDDGHELPLHPVELAQLVGGLRLLPQQVLQALGLLREELVLLGELVGQRPAAEVHLPGEHQRREEHEHRPHALGLVEARDHDPEQAQPDVGQEELDRPCAVHLREHLVQRDVRRQRRLHRDDERVRRIRHDRGEQQARQHEVPDLVDAAERVEYRAAAQDRQRHLSAVVEGLEQADLSAELPWVHGSEERDHPRDRHGEDDRHGELDRERQRELHPSPGRDRDQVDRDHDHDEHDHAERQDLARVLRQADREPGPGDGERQKHPQDARDAVVRPVLRVRLCGGTGNRVGRHLTPPIRSLPRPRAPRDVPGASRRR